MGDNNIKRVIALGGDTVDLRDGVLYVNGIAEEGSYIVGNTYSESSTLIYPYTV